MSEEVQAARSRGTLDDAEVPPQLPSDDALLRPSSSPSVTDTAGLRQLDVRQDVWPAPVMGYPR